MDRLGIYWFICFEDCMPLSVVTILTVLFLMGENSPINSPGRRQVGDILGW